MGVRRVAVRNSKVLRSNGIDLQLTDHSDCLMIRYVITELMQSDLHKIIVSPQHLSTDHIKVFLYQILRGMLSFNMIISNFQQLLTLFFVFPQD